MRISAKGRYGLAAAVQMVEYQGAGAVPIAAIAEKLGISKIYLEQIFTLLKRAGLVQSVKGSQGGYLLARGADQITACGVLSALEQLLFEETEPSVAELAPGVEQAMRQLVYAPLDQSVRSALQAVTLADLSEAARANGQAGGYMFFI